MKGWSAVEEYEEQKAARDAEFEANNKPMLFIGKKTVNPIALRFLEQGDDVNTFYVHDYKVPDSGVQGGFATRRFTCSQQPPWNSECAGCKGGLKRKLRGVYNVIQRQRPVVRRDSDGKAMKNSDGSWVVDGFRDEVVIVSVGQPTATMLRHADGQYRGLMSRDFVVQYSGDTFQAWSMAPAVDGAGNAMATPLSEADQQLAAAKFNLDEFMAPKSLQEQAQIVARYGGNSGASPQGQSQQAAAPGNPMLAGAVMPAGTNALGMATGAAPAPQPQPAQ